MHKRGKGGEMRNKKKWYFHLTITVLTIFFFHAGAIAESSVNALQVCFWNPYQIFNSETSISGIRFNLPYGVNQNLFGIDIGLGNKVQGDMKGLQLGLLNLIDGNYSGLQVGSFNRVKGPVGGIQMGLYNSSQEEAKGIQCGVVNTSQEFKGLQFGIVNHATSMRGFQIGLLYNTADTIYGIQIGFLNFIWSKEPLPFIPIINGSF